MKAIDFFSTASSSMRKCPGHSKLLHLWKNVYKFSEEDMPELWDTFSNSLDL